MPAKLHNGIKWNVIQHWLEGYPRNTVAAKFNISAGSVSNIIDEWRNAVGPELANIVRDLSVTLKKLGMSPAQFSTAMRIRNLFDMMGYDERSAEIFLTEVYGRLQELGITPKHIAGYVNGFKSLLDNLNPSLVGNSIGRKPTISLLDIDQIMEKRAEYIHSLKDRYTVFETKFHEIRQRISSSESELQDLHQRKRRVEIDLQWKSDLQDELQKNGIATNSITTLVENARFFNDRGLDLNELLKTFSTYRRLQDEIVAQGRYLEAARTKAQEIMDKNSIQEGLLQENTLKVSELETIKRMGFGLSELKRLYLILNEISSEAGLPTEENAAVKKFFQQFDEHYDDFMNLGKKIDERKIQLQKLLDAININSITLGLAPEVVEMTRSLARQGYRKEHLENLMRIIRENPMSQFKDAVIPPRVKNFGDITNAEELIAKNERITDIPENSASVKRQGVPQNQATPTSPGEDTPYFPPMPGDSQLRKNRRPKPVYPPGIGKKYPRRTRKLRTS
jgi:hypothetical protein